MRVYRVPSDSVNDLAVELLDDADQPIAVVSQFLHHLRARGYSPNTLSAYAYDLLHFTRFLSQEHLTYEEFTPAYSLAFLDYLSHIPSRRQAQRASLVLCTTTDDGRPTTRLSPATINRTFAAVSSFYEYLILSGHLKHSENPILKEDDYATSRVSERHQPFMGHDSRQRPIRRTVRVKTIQYLPRPLSDEEIKLLRASLHRWRDKAMFLLMLQGGLRPGEVLSLHLEDLQYGRKRVIVRYRTDHPKVLAQNRVWSVLLTCLNRKRCRLSVPM